MCTGVRFSDGEGNMYFGRNLDWSTGYGQKVVIAPRGYKYKSAFLGEMVNYPAVIGMGIVAENTPLYFDCANEHGLAVAGLNFPGYAAYESDAVDGKTNVAAYEFPLWVALNFTSVDEAEKALREVAIVGAKPETQEMQVQSLSQEDPLEEGNPLQYSCPENPTDRRAWWATVHSVTRSQT